MTAANARRSRWVRALALVGLLLTTLGAASRPAGAVEDLVPARRLLVFVVPGLEWPDVREDTTPTIAAWRSEAGIGLLSTRVGHARASLGDAYLTIGAGTRAISVENDGGYAFMRGEELAGVPAFDVYEQRTGRPPAAPIAHVSITELTIENEESSFGARVGSIGRELARAGVGRAVITNGDRDEVPALEGPFRAAVGALMDERGRLPGGLVDQTLLVRDALAPFGVRTDADAVVDAFERAWTDEAAAEDRSVVLVEASDGFRAERSLRRATPERADEIREQFHRDADTLFGRILASVDPERDAVLLLGLPVSTARPSLGVVALGTPTFGEGMLESPSTRRPGYVVLADIGPTILTLMGVESETPMEGRPVYLDDDADGGALGQHELEGSISDAVFRSDALAPFMVSIGVVGAVVLALDVVRRRRGRNRSHTARVLGEAVLAVMTASFLIGLSSDAKHLAGPFLATLLLTTAALTAVAMLADLARPGAGTALLLAALVATIGVDLATGANLQLNTMFGYSSEVGGRFAGIGNLAFALLAPASLLLAVLVTVLVPGRAARGVAVGIMVVTVLVDGLPYLGADVGGVLSMVPAFALAWWVLDERPIRVAHLAGLVVTTIGIVIVFGFIDLARPARQRAHLARLAEQVSDDGPQWIVTTVARRWQGSFGGPVTSIIALVVAIGVVVGVVVIGRRLLRRAEENPNGARLAPDWFPERPEARALLVGLSVLGVLGLFLNDSSVAVPALMLLVIVAALAAVAGVVPATEPDASGAPSGEPGVVRR